MKRKKIDLEKIRAMKKNFGPYAVPISNGIKYFFIRANSLEEADKLADQKESEIRGRDALLRPCPN